MPFALPLLLLSLALVGCQSLPREQGAYPVGLVSSHSQEAELMGALAAAQFDAAFDGVEAFGASAKANVKTNTLAKWPKRKIAVGRVWPEESAPMAGEGISTFWQKEAANTGWILSEKAAHLRLNDALLTTPSGGKVAFLWLYNDVPTHVTVLPNTPAYVPQHSGGVCRDAVVGLSPKNQPQQHVRGLFCQKGPKSLFKAVFLEEILG